MERNRWIYKPVYICISYFKMYVLSEIFRLNFETMYAPVHVKYSVDEFIKRDGIFLREKWKKIIKKEYHNL